MAIMKMGNLVRLCVSILFAGIYQQALAANFSVTCPGPQEPDFGCWIDMRGPIVEGDAKKLLQIVALRPKSSDVYKWLVLDSPGGDVREALNLARVVRDVMLETNNYSLAPQVEDWGRNEYRCASSCVIVLMAGGERSFRITKGGVGLHRPYLSGGYSDNTAASKVAEMQNQAMRVVRDFLTNERVPQRLIEEMMNRSSRDIYWITMQDLFEIPSTSAWLEEILIARCGYDPSIHERSSRAVLANNQAAIDSSIDEYRRIGQCKRALIVKAQENFRARPR